MTMRKYCKEEKKIRENILNVECLCLERIYLAINGLELFHLVER